MNMWTIARANFRQGILAVLLEARSTPAPSGASPNNRLIATHLLMSLATRMIPPRSIGISLAVLYKLTCALPVLLLQNATIEEQTQLYENFCTFLLAQDHVHLP